MSRRGQQKYPTERRLMPSSHLTFSLNLALSARANIRRPKD